jgi:hypothetical protein
MKRALLSLLLPLALVGCGESPNASAPPVGEVRGQPINAPTAKTNLAQADSNSRAAASSTLQTDAPALSTVAASTANASNVAAEIAPAPLASSTTSPAPSPEATAGGAPGYPLVGFDKLSGYKIEIPDDLLGPVTNDLPQAKTKTESLIPDKVKAYSKKSVSLRGFMLPLKVEGGLVTELLIMKDQSMCCFGTVPKIHEWVSVKMKDKGVKPVMDQPVSLQGTLHVGEMRENGYLTGIYQMDGERLGPEE